eukprot:Lankesteria_metandrocarpae@DN2711_c0_g1_i1.p1
MEELFASLGKQHPDFIKVSNPARNFESFPLLPHQNENIQPNTNEQTDSDAYMCNCDAYELLEEAMKRIKSLEEENQILQTNMSVMFVTAQREIRTKDEKLARKSERVRALKLVVQNLQTSEQRGPAV